MIELYDFKLIKSGKEIEVYQYKDKKMIRGYEQRQRKKEQKKQEEKEKEAEECKKAGFSYIELKWTTS